MPKTNDKQELIRFADRIGMEINKDTIEYIDVHFQKTFDFLPELALFIASYTVRKTFTRRTAPPRFIKDSIRFFFHNVFDDTEQAKGKRKPKAQEKMPYVRVFPSAQPHMSVFKKNSHIKVVSVIISADYLKSFLKQDTRQYPFLFDTGSNFLIEEIMTDDILRTVNDLVKKEEPGALKTYHYKLKAMELLFYLFQSLGKREKAVHQKLSEREIRSIYKVRNKIAAVLSKPSSIDELRKIAGMNELKMRKLFSQVFGMGIYDYYQHLRMKEAARLIRDEKLSVSETGYRMGFENLSHFTRVFEKHIGKKPKRYSRELT